MTPDIKVKDYYLNYISNVRSDFDRYREDIKEINILLDELHKFIEEHTEDLITYYNIDLNLYKTEWEDKEFVDNSKLYKTVVSYISDTDNTPARATLIQLMKYLLKLKEKNRINETLQILDKRKNITIGKYREYLELFYHKVHEIVLNGLGYKFCGGIGVFVINYWKVSMKSSNVYTDWQRSNRNKRELLAKGLKPYDEEEAKWYAERGLEYNGIKYKVPRSNTHYIEQTIVDSRIFIPKSMKFDITQYVHIKYKGYTTEELADKYIHKKEDLYRFPVSLNHKVNMMIYKFPETHLNLIRNADGQKY